MIKNLVFSAFCQLFDFFWPNKSIKDDIFWAFFAGRDEKSKQNGPSGKSGDIKHFAVHNCVFTNRLYLFSQCRFKGRTEYYKLFWLQKYWVVIIVSILWMTLNWLTSLGYCMHFLNFLIANSGTQCKKKLTIFCISTVT